MEYINKIPVYTFSPYPLRINIPMENKNNIFINCLLPKSINSHRIIQNRFLDFSEAEMCA